MIPSERSQAVAKPVTDRAKPEIVARIVLETELSKQLKPPLTNQQREQLVRDLLTLGESEAQLRKRSLSVKCKETYGTIGFQHWVADMVCPRTEIERIAAFKASRMFARAKLKELFDQEVVEGEAIATLNRMYEDEMEARVRKAMDKKDSEVNRARLIVQKMTAGERARLLRRAVKAGLIPKYDEIILENIAQKFIVQKLMALLKCKQNGV